MVKAATMSARARAEQDYWFWWYASGWWLDRWGPRPTLTEAERLEFFEYDSHGGARPENNPILHGKRLHGIQRTMYWESYFAEDGSWVGGLELVNDYLLWCPYGWRPLYEFFFEDMVDRWVDAFMGQFHRPFSMPLETGMI